MELYAKIGSSFGKNCSRFYSLIKQLAALKKKPRYSCFLVNFMKHLLKEQLGTTPSGQNINVIIPKENELNIKHNYTLPHFHPAQQANVALHCCLRRQSEAATRICSLKYLFLKNFAIFTGKLFHWDNIQSISGSCFWTFTLSFKFALFNFSLFPIQRQPQKVLYKKTVLNSNLRGLVNKFPVLILGIF